MSKNNNIIIAWLGILATCLLFGQVLAQTEAEYDTTTMESTSTPSATERPAPTVAQIVEAITNVQKNVANVLSKVPNIKVASQSNLLQMITKNQDTQRVHFYDSEGDDNDVDVDVTTTEQSVQKEEEIEEESMDDIESSVTTVPTDIIDDASNEQNETTHVEEKIKEDESATKDEETIIDGAVSQDEVKEEETISKDVNNMIPTTEQPNIAKNTYNESSEIVQDEAVDSVVVTVRSTNSNDKEVVGSESETVDEESNHNTTISNDRNDTQDNVETNVDAEEAGESADSNISVIESVANDTPTNQQETVSNDFEATETGGYADSNISVIESVANDTPTDQQETVSNDFEDTEILQTEEEQSEGTVELVNNEEDYEYNSTLIDFHALSTPAVSIFSYDGISQWFNWAVAMRDPTMNPEGTLGWPTIISRGVQGIFHYYNPLRRFMSRALDTADTINSLSAVYNNRRDVIHALLANEIMPDLDSITSYAEKIERQKIANKKIVERINLVLTEASSKSETLADAEADAAAADATAELEAVADDTTGLILGEGGLDPFAFLDDTFLAAQAPEELDPLLDMFGLPFGDVLRAPFYVKFINLLLKALYVGIALAFIPFSGIDNFFLAPLPPNMDTFPGMLRFVGLQALLGPDYLVDYDYSDEETDALDAEYDEYSDEYYDDGVRRFDEKKKNKSKNKKSKTKGKTNNKNKKVVREEPKSSYSDLHHEMYPPPSRYGMSSYASLTYPRSGETAKPQPDYKIQSRSGEVSNPKLKSKSGSSVATDPKVIREKSPSELNEGAKHGIQKIIYPPLLAERKTNRVPAINPGIIKTSLSSENQVQLTATIMPDTINKNYPSLEQITKEATTNKYSAFTDTSKTTQPSKYHPKLERILSTSLLQNRSGYSHIRDTSQAE